MRTKLGFSVGAMFIVLGLLGAGLFASGAPVSADEGHDGERGELHEQMHEMMDSMMGEGHSDEMHEVMPGSEEMMEACTSAMEENGMSGMGNMMNGMHHMKPGMDDMMGNRN